MPGISFQPNEPNQLSIVKCALEKSFSVECNSAFDYALARAITDRRAIAIRGGWKWREIADINISHRGCKQSCRVENQEIPGDDDDEESETSRGSDCRNKKQFSYFLSSRAESFPRNELLGCVIESR